jgi:hypothetical protein
VNPTAPTDRRDGGLPLLPLIMFAVFLAAGSLILCFPGGLFVVAAVAAAIAVAIVVDVVRAERRFNTEAEREHEERLQ